MLNNYYAPNYSEALNQCVKIYASTKDDSEVLDYLIEVASYDIKCIGQCEQWAMQFYNENELEIEQRK